MWWYAPLSTSLSVAVGAAFALSPSKRERLGERFGSWHLRGGPFLWLHGASVGEVNGLLPIISQLRALSPQRKLLLTATTVRGLERGAGAANESRLLPLDSPLWIQRALRDLTLEGLIIAETELWPGLLHELAKLSIPVALVNARISDYTAHRYRRFRALFQPGLRSIRCIAVTDETSRSRFVDLGVPTERVTVTGHTKYDIRPRADLERAKALRASVFEKAARLLVLGSLRPGEEEWWFPALSSVCKEHQEFSVVIAPRHMECVEHFEQKLRAIGLPFKLSSILGSGSAPSTEQVLLLDTFGELEGWYAAADAAFIGATCVDIGGHNPLEAAQYGVPIVVGPYTSVIEEPIQALDREGGLVRLRGQEEVAEFLGRFCAEANELQTCGLKAARVAAQFRGATSRTLGVLCRFGFLESAILADAAAD